MPLYLYLYCTKWRSGQVLPMPHSLTDSQRKDRATQLLIKYKSGALLTQLHNGCLEPLSHEVLQNRAFDWLFVLFHCRF